MDNNCKLCRYNDNGYCEVHNTNCDYDISEYCTFFWKTQIKNGCPFCGTANENIEIQPTATGNPSFKIKCPNCRMQTAWENSLASAISTWNRRQ